jgi:HAE1 family hydrophobic/amphiphilic exporter-1
MVGGQKVGTYEENGRQVDVRMRADVQFRGDGQVLTLLPVLSPSGALVPLATWCRIRESSGPAAINRLARQRVATVVANAGPGYGQSEIGDALARHLRRDGPAPGYDVAPAGMTKEAERMWQECSLGFGLAFVFMYLVLAAQFESWLHPLTILLSLPLTVPFALLSLHLVRPGARHVLRRWACFVLFGIVKKNAILQIDHTNQLRARRAWSGATRSSRTATACGRS